MIMAICLCQLTALRVWYWLSPNSFFASRKDFSTKYLLHWRRLTPQWCSRAMAFECAGFSKEGIRGKFADAIKKAGPMQNTYAGIGTILTITSFRILWKLNSLQCQTACRSNGVGNPVIDWLKRIPFYYIVSQYCPPPVASAKPVTYVLIWLLTALI